MSLKNQLDKLFEDYLKEDDLEEASTSLNAPGYETPNAFSSDKESAKKKQKKYSTSSTGYKLVEDKKMKHSDIMKQVMGLSEVSYRNYKQDDTSSNKHKVNNAIKEINRKLYEIERSIGQNIKLKTETGVEAGKYWKSTKSRLTKIAERLVKVAGSIRELGS